MRVLKFLLPFSVTGISLSCLFWKKKTTMHDMGHTARQVTRFVISGFRRELDENCALMHYYAASSDNSVPTFRNNLSVPSSWVKNSIKMRSRCETALSFWKSVLSGMEIYTYLLTYLLTPWSKVLLEKLTGSQLVKKFPTFYGTRRFITAFTSARHLPLSWARSIQSMTPILLPQDPS
jgi:hypothetical protein